MEKRCRLCGELKPIEDFYAMAGMRDGHRNECKACGLAAKAARHQANPTPARERAKQWRLDNPERYQAQLERWRASGKKKAADRRSYLKRTFGITPEDYDAMLEKQGGCCAICRREARTDTSLHVDHCHETGAIRGLLCFDCNAGLGKFQDDPAILQAAIAYLSG